MAAGARAEDDTVEAPLAPLREPPAPEVAVEEPPEPPVAVAEESLPSVALESIPPAPPVAEGLLLSVAEAEELAPGMAPAAPPVG